MSCDRFQYLITTSEAPLSPADATFVAAHREACPKCAQYERNMSGIVSLLRSVPELKTDDNFVSAVMARVRADDRAPVTLWDRLLGTPVHSVRRAYALAGAAAVCLMLLVGGIALRSSLTPPSPNAGSQVIAVSDLPVSDPGVVETKAMLEAQRYAAMAQPLSDDPGMQLVSYVPADE